MPLRLNNRAAQASKMPVSYFCAGRVTRPPRWRVVLANNRLTALRSTSNRNGDAMNLRFSNPSLFRAPIGVLALLVLGANDTAAAASKAQCQSQAATLQIALEAHFATEAREGGVSAAVVSPECGLWAGTAGSAGPGTLRPDHLLRIGSVTKTFVAAAILALVEEDELSLESTLDRWRLAVPRASSITVRQLLNHSSGIANYTDDTAFMTAVQADPTRPWPPEALVEVALNLPAPPPGPQSYSNTNYVLLGMILETELQTPAAEVLASWAIAPADLEHTFVPDGDPWDGSLARGFGVKGQDLTHAVHPSVPWTAGNMVATASDLALWAHTLYGDDLLDDATRAEMLVGIDVPGLPGVAYGLGVTLFDASVVGTPLVGHDGGIFGYRTSMYHLPEMDMSVAVIHNSEEGSTLDALGALVAVLRSERGLKS